MGKVQQKALRESNLELLRIFAMLAIIAHHSVVNSTVLQCADFQSPQVNDWFLALWGAWGKTAINSFILISGYFLCKGTLTWQRWLKLYIQIVFYSWTIMLIFAITGYEMPRLYGIVRRLLFPFSGVNNGFGSSFMVFYAGVPLYNKVLNGLSQRNHILLLVVLLGMFTFSSSVFGNNTMNEPFWYMTLYFVAAYIRLYPNRWLMSLSFSISMLVVTFSLAVASIVFLLARHGNFWGAYQYISDSNKIFAFMVGLSAFLVAKNAPKFHNKAINTLASGCFGVLLIHASSDTMRRWLWQDIVDVPGLYYCSTEKLIAISVIVPILIYFICSMIDLLRQRWIERPLMNWMNGM